MLINIENLLIYLYIHNNLLQKTSFSYHICDQEKKRQIKSEHTQYLHLNLSKFRSDQIKIIFFWIVL